MSVKDKKESSSLGHSIDNPNTPELLRDDKYEKD